MHLSAQIDQLHRSRRSALLAPRLDDRPREARYSVGWVAGAQGLASRSWSWRSYNLFRVGEPTHSMA